MNGDDTLKVLQRIERHLNQITWLMLLVWLSVVGLTFVVAAASR